MVYGIEERAIVMEVVEGPTLADLMRQGALRLDEPLGIARQVADVLEAAHEKGVTHRDLKPRSRSLFSCVDVLNAVTLVLEGRSVGPPEQFPTSVLARLRIGGHWHANVERLSDIGCRVVVGISTLTGCDRTSARACQCNRVSGNGTIPRCGKGHRQPGSGRRVHCKGRIPKRLVC